MELRNNRAYKEFEFEEEYEAGIELTGTEVKSLREGRGSVDGAYAKVEGEEVFVFGMTIPRYDHASRRQNHEPTRPRKLLLRKNQINRLIGMTARKGRTIVVKRLYFRNGHAKLEIAVAQQKDRSDRREDIKKKEAERRMRRARKGK